MPMPEWFTALLTWIEYLAETLPPSVFVAFGAALEEIIAIIPSSAILVAAGGIVAAQGGSVAQIVWLSVVSGAVKTVISYGFYALADVLEDNLPPKILRVFGYRQGEAERFGAHLSKGWKDAFVLLFLRALPIIPSLPVSLVCGFLKTDVKTYLWTSLVGFSVKSAAYILVGYYGIELLDAWV